MCLEGNHTLFLISVCEFIVSLKIWVGGNTILSHQTLGTYISISSAFRESIYQSWTTPRIIFFPLVKWILNQTILPIGIIVEHLESLDNIYHYYENV